jgi:cyanophycinase-like exopeptidase
MVGAGEYLAPMEPVDRGLLARLAGPPRVVVLPTAAAPDGPGVPERWASMGVEHFTRLGADVEPVMLLTRADAESAALAERISAANFVYLSGGKPRYLLETLQGSACWQAITGVLAAGGVVAGCSAGAMVLGGALVDWPQLWRTLPALGVVPNLVVIPHFDELPSRLTLPVLTRAARPRLVAGIDGMTALVVAGGKWQVAGKGTVTIFAGDGSSRRYADGESITLPADK